MTTRKVSHWKYHSMAIRKGVKSDMSHCKKTFSISFLALFSGDFTLKLTMSFLTTAQYYIFYISGGVGKGDAGEGKRCKKIFIHCR